MRALRDEVILLPDTAVPEKSAGGIHLVDFEDAVQQPGAIPAEVIALGPDAPAKCPEIEVGSMVYFYSRNNRSAIFEHDGKTYCRVLATDIDALIDDTGG